MRCSNSSSVAAPSSRKSLKNEWRRASPPRHAADGPARSGFLMLLDTVTSCVSFRRSSSSLWLSSRHPFLGRPS